MCDSCRRRGRHLDPDSVAVLHEQKSNKQTNIKQNNRQQSDVKLITNKSEKQKNSSEKQKNNSDSVFEKTTSSSSSSQRHRQCSKLLKQTTPKSNVASSKITSRSIGNLAIKTTASSSLSSGTPKLPLRTSNIRKANSAITINSVTATVAPTTRQQSTQTDEVVLIVPEKMSDIATPTVVDGAQNGPEMATVMDNFPKKVLVGPRPVQVTTSSQILTNTQTSSTSQQRVAKLASQCSTSSVAQSNSSVTSASTSRVQHVTSTSTSTSTSTAQMKSDIAELRSSISEMKTLSEMQNGYTAHQNIQNISNRIRSSMENLVDGGGATVSPVVCGGCCDIDCDYCNVTAVVGSPEPLVSFPPTPDTVVVSSPLICSTNGNGAIPLISSAATGATIGTNAADTSLKFEHQRIVNQSKRKVVTDSFSAEKATANSAEMKLFEAGDVKYQENNAAAATRARVCVDGVTAESNMAKLQEASLLKTSEITQSDIHKQSASAIRVQSDNFTAENMASSKTLTASSVYNHEKHHVAKSTHSSQSNYTITQKTNFSTKATSLASQMSNQQVNGIINEDELLTSMDFKDLDQLYSSTNPQDVEKAIAKYQNAVSACVKSLRSNPTSAKAPDILNKMNDMIRKAWAIPTHGHELGLSLCNALRECGGLDLLIANCTADDNLQYPSAQLLEQCLTTENRAYVVENGLDKVVKVACGCTRANSVDHSRVGTGILEHLFKHSESTCSEVIKLGGLDYVLFECRKNDIETLRHCAGALANLSLYGGAENQEKMIKRKVPMWLFPLAFHNDDNIKYYACLAIAVLVANKEIEAAVLKSGTLDLVEPFVTSHNPFDFAKSNLAHAHGQSKNWLQRLVPVLSSEREAARNLAAFHFCMEAGIKKQQGNTEIFQEIGAIEPLKKVASCPNAVASKYAAQALRLMGEEVPHKLSQQVPLWSVEDVREWVKQIGFNDYADKFVTSRVDGDLLLQITEQNLENDIGLKNGIQRRRFTRELQNLKKMADYSSRDTENLNGFLQSIGPEFSIYTYSMLNAGVNMNSIKKILDDQLLNECGITNSIHRIRILEAIRNTENCLTNPYFNEESRDKSLDVFVSYRRSNGSQLASLLKVHLQLRGFSVFIDVERLEAGKFDNNLLQSIRQAKHFLLVLTPKALDRCIGDHERKDWVHREIVAALQSQCNIIPIIDNFQWPEPEELPEDMRAVCHFNGVRWIHDYQDACVDKLERFLRGEMNMRADGNMMNIRSTSTNNNRGDGTPGTPACGIPRQPPSYQRMHSNDSASGKGSDKDANGTSGGRE